MREFLEFGREPVFEYDGSWAKGHTGVPPVDRSLEVIARRILKSRPPSHELTSTCIPPEDFAVLIESYVEEELHLALDTLRIEVSDINKP